MHREVFGQAFLSHPLGIMGMVMNAEVSKAVDTYLAERRRLVRRLSYRSTVGYRYVDIDGHLHPDSGPPAGIVARRIDVDRMGIASSVRYLLAEMRAEAAGSRVSQFL